MKKQNIILAAVSLLAVFSCNKEVDVIPSDTPEQAAIYTMSITAGKADTKALNLSGNTLNATWADGESVDVYNSSDVKIGKLYVTDIRDNGATCTLDGTLDTAPSQGETLTLKYCGFNYGEQAGTIEYIAANCDYATAEVTVSSVDSNNHVSVQGSATFVNHQAIVKFTLKNNAGTEDIAANSLKLNVNGMEITVTPASATNELYLAVPAVNGKPITLLATTDAGKRGYNKTSVSFAKGQYYEITVKMSNVVYVRNESELYSAIADGAYIMLDTDIPIQSYLKIGENDTQDVTIDLNNHSISRTGLSGADANGHVIEVFGNGTLTILGGFSSGMISDGWANNGGGICNYGKLTLQKVDILSCKAVNGGAIMNNSGATLTMIGSSICGCSSEAGGGAIVNHGTATISDCELLNNTATTRGGAIWSDGTLTVSNTYIWDNKALAAGEGGDGGAIHLQAGTATLTDVTITDNSSKDAGGIYVNSGATLNLGGDSGSFISSNTSSEHGGGGIVNYGTVNLSGTVDISGNTCHTNGGGIWNNGTLTMEGNIIVKDNTGDDVYLKTNKLITTGTLTCAANSIGVNMETQKVFTSGYGTNNTEHNHFFPSGTVSDVTYSEGEASLVKNYKYITCSWNATTKTVEQTVCDAPSSYNIITSSTTMIEGWNVVTRSVTISDRLACDSSGDVKIILCDGAHLTLENGLAAMGSSLTIYSQSYGSVMGKITATADDWQAGIGGDDYCNAGTIYIHGGNINATGGEGAAGIGGGGGGNGGTFIVYGGIVVAHGGENGSGIGGGEGRHLVGDNRDKGNGGSVTIYGGTVSAYAGTDAAGIGSGGIASSYPAEALNGGSLTVYGGHVFADGTDVGCGIGGGRGADGAIVSIHGGVVEAWCGSGSDVWAFGSNLGDGHRGSISLDDGMRVYGGTEPSTASLCPTVGERVPYCYWRDYVKIEPCTSHSGSPCTYCNHPNN